MKKKISLVKYYLYSIFHIFLIVPRKYNLIYIIKNKLKNMRFNILVCVCLLSDMD